jgi:hypothetical protein
MSVTPSDLYERSARIMGARTGTLGTVAAGATGYTTAVLNGVVNTTGDPTAYAGWRLIFLDSPEGSKETFIYDFAPSTGVATFLDLTDDPVEGERYILVPREDYTLNEWRNALDKALLETPRSYRQVVPLTPLLNRYPLDVCDWLTGAGDIDDVRLTISPLMLHNEDFSLWQDGPNAEPDGYTLLGGTVQRVAGGTRSNYAALITAPGDSVARFVQSIPAALAQWITRRTFPIYIPMRAAAWVSTTSPNGVRIFISDGVTEHLSGYVTANGVPQFPTLSLTPTADMTGFAWGILLDAGASATVSWAGLMQNTIDFNSNFSIKDSGSQSIAYVETPVNKRIVNQGGIPYILLPPQVSTTWGQVLAYVRRPFPVWSSDDDSYDNQYARVLTAGLLVFLLQANKPQQDRERIDEIRAQQQRIWKRMAGNLLDLPVPTSTMQNNITGA